MSQIFINMFGRLIHFCSVLSGPRVRYHSVIPASETSLPVAVNGAPPASTIYLISNRAQWNRSYGRITFSTLILYYVPVTKKDLRRMQCGLPTMLTANIKSADNPVGSIEF